MTFPLIWRLTEQDVEPAGALLARAFAEEPIHRFAVPDVSPTERAEILRPYFVSAVRYGCRFGEAWAIGQEPGLMTGVGWWIPLPEAEITDERIAEAGAATLPPETLQALERVLMMELPVQEILAGLLPQHHRHLAQLGIEPTVQGQGLGRALLSRLLADAAAAQVPLCLWTATPSNVPFYQGASMELLVEQPAAREQPAWWAFGTAMTAP